MTAMIPIGELLSDKVFRRFFSTPPPMYPHQASRPDGWRLWMKTTPDSPWRRKDVQHYDAGVRHILRRLEEGAVHDAVLQCRGVSYKPPIRRIIVKSPATRQPVMVADPKTGELKPKILQKVWEPNAQLIQEYGPHAWCYYCRRPTVFAYFAKHHAFTGTALEPYYDGSVRRCCVCGISHDSGRRY